MTKSLESLAALGEIIVSSRRRAGAGKLSDGELAKESGEWAEILADVPSRRFHDSYIRAMRDRTVKGLLQPQEVLAAWRAINEEETRTRDLDSYRRFEIEKDEASKCRYCNGIGWQSLMDKPGHTCVRACSCSAAPASERNQEPFREPYWKLEPAKRWWVKVETSETERTSQ